MCVLVKMRVRESHGEIWGDNWVVWNEARSGFTCGGGEFLKKYIFSPSFSRFSKIWVLHIFSKGNSFTSNPLRGK